MHFIFFFLRSITTFKSSYFLRSIGTLKTLKILRSNTTQLSKSPDIYYANEGYCVVEKHMLNVRI